MSVQNSELKEEIFRLSLPAVGEMLLHLLLINADTLMIGQLSASSAALAAVGLSKQISGIMTILLFAIATGTIALVSRYIGAKDYKSATKVANQSLLIGFVLSTAILIIGITFAEQFLQLLGAEPEVLAVGTGYLKLIFASLLPSGLMIIGGNIVRGCGDTKFPMIATAIMNIINIFLNWLLIFGIAFFPKLGILGAGIATLFARLMGVIIILAVIKIKDLGVKLNLKHIFSFDKITLNKIFKIGIPSGLERLAFKGGQLVVVRVIAILGTVAVATRQISLAIETFSTLPSYGLSIAATTLVGQKLGADDDSEAQAGSLLASRFGVLATIIMGLIFYFFAERLAGFYTDDSQLIQEAAFSLRILALAQPAKALNMILGGSFRGAGDTKFPMYLTFIGVWGLALPLTYLLGVQFSFGLAGIWWAMVADEWFRAIVCITRFRSNKWKQVEIK